jgi:hypothetical protein
MHAFRTVLKPGIWQLGTSSADLNGARRVFGSQMGDYDVCQAAKGFLALEDAGDCVGTLVNLKD